VIYQFQLRSRGNHPPAEALDDEERFLIGRTLAAHVPATGQPYSVRVSRDVHEDGPVTVRTIRIEVEWSRIMD
jgi:hypothetical protein